MASLPLETEFLLLVALKVITWPCIWPEIMLAREFLVLFFHKFKSISFLFYVSNLKKGHNVQKDGLPDYANKLRIVGAQNSHFTLYKGAALLGLGQNSIVKVASHPTGNMIVEELESTIEGLKSQGFILIFEY